MMFKKALIENIINNIFYFYIFINLKGNIRLSKIQTTYITLKQLKVI